MKNHIVLKIIGLQVLIAGLIAFPFFRIKYFETGSTNEIILNYLIYPILITSVVLILYLYFKHLRKLNEKTNSKMKKFLQDFFSITLLSLFSSGILYGLILSAIITSNAYLKPLSSIIINEPVIEYEPYTTRYGRLRHYIKFENPQTKRPYRIEVFREYKVGEVFSKEMKIGRWNQIYSFE